MKRLIAGALVVTLAVLGACDSRSTPPPASPEPSNTGAGRVDPEDPKAGTNTNRPDSIKDVKPGSDSGAPPVHNQQ